MSEQISSKLGNAFVEKDSMSDNLAIVLCTYFERHPCRPDDDKETENGWGKWVEQKTDTALDLIIEQLAL